MIDGSRPRILKFEVNAPPWGQARQPLAGSIQGVLDGKEADPTETGAELDNPPVGISSPTAAETRMATGSRSARGSPPQ